MKNVYANLKLIRQSRGMTQQMIAERLGMLQSNYGRLERGLIPLTLQRLEQIAGIFEMNAEDVLYYHTSHTPELVVLKREKDRLQLELDTTKRENELLKKMNSILEQQLEFMRKDRIQSFGGRR